MSTKAGTMGFSGRPALFTFWTVAVSALAGRGADPERGGTQRGGSKAIDP
jgi:hypothetical protein